MRGDKRKVGTGCLVWANRWWRCYLLTRKNKGGSDLEGKKLKRVLLDMPVWHPSSGRSSWELEKRFSLEIKIPKLLPYHQHVKPWKSIDREESPGYSPTWYLEVGKGGEACRQWPVKDRTWRIGAEDRTVLLRNRSILCTSQTSYFSLQGKNNSMFRLAK